MDLNGLILADKKPHTPGKCGLRAEGLAVHKISPAADDLPQQQTKYRHICQRSQLDLLPAGKQDGNNNAHNDGTVNGDSSIPDSDHTSPIHSPLCRAVKVQIKEDVINAGTKDTTGHCNERHVHHMVLRKSVMLRLLHGKKQSRQHGYSQNNSVPIDTMAYINGYRVQLKFPVPKKARKTHGHIFHCCQSDTSFQRDFLFRLQSNVNLR